MSVNKEYLIDTLTFIFGSCPLTDEFIDDMDKTCYNGLDTIVSCQIYMRDELKMSYTEEYKRMVLNENNERKL